MKKHNIKTLLLTGFSFFALSLHPAFAADDHGHSHDEPAHEESQDDHGHDHDDEEGQIKLTPAQIEAAGIKVESVSAQALGASASVPGKITPAADRMARTVPKAAGIVVEARKNLGDSVEKGEILALIESREMAEAVADYLASRRSEELARTNFNREKSLWEKKITAEQDYLNARNAHQEAKIRVDLAHQKLHALGHDEDMIKAYDKNTGKADIAETLRFHEIRAPLSGRVIGRELTLGEYVDTTHAAFTIADLSLLWVEIALPPADLATVKEGQSANVTSGNQKAQGKLIFVSPAIDPDTRTAKAIIELDNKDGTWRPGAFAHAVIATASNDAATNIKIPQDAVQSMNGSPAVFVRTADGFEKRDVVTGRSSNRDIEVLSGLKSGESIAVTSTFTLKAELGKAEAEHAH